MSDVKNTEQGDKVLKAAIGQIERKIGKDACLSMGEAPAQRFIHISGPESSGKTTLSLALIAEVQKDGATCAYVDAKHALDPDYAAEIGVNVDDLLVSLPDTSEQALEIVDKLVQSQAVDLIVVHSAEALVPKAGTEGDAGEQRDGGVLAARWVSQAPHQITGTTSNQSCVLIFLSA